MFFETALYFVVLASETLRFVNSYEPGLFGPPSCNNPKGYLFEDINVTSFIDENRYIRLNVSWDRPIANFSSFEMTIDTNCNALYGERNISTNKHFVIQPDIERLKHPAEPILHGCEYTFELFKEITTNNDSCIMSQAINYVIPECVDTVCECGVADSPYKLEKVEYIKGNIYEIRFIKSEREVGINLETVFDKVWYMKKDSNNTASFVHPKDIRFKNNRNSFTVPFNDFHKGNAYVIYIDLLLDNCEYHFRSELQVPGDIKTENKNHYFIFTVIFIILFIGVSVYLSLTKWPKLLNKLGKFLPFLPQIHSPQDYSQEPITERIRKEVINSQYTPLEFIVNAYKYDKFEFPRNKIVLRNEIGGGAFGKVYKADVYELGNQPEYTTAAAKKPIENAPQEEITDFLEEIKTMKKIQSLGGHKNVIKILACVTIDPPYVMIMELVPCGSLKSYLSTLRKEWENRKRERLVQKDNRHFFPDNMVVENFLPKTYETEQKNETEKLKYSALNFDDYTGSSGTNSYITPDTPRTPSTPGSPYITPNPANFNKRRLSRLSNPKRPKLKTNLGATPYLGPVSPITPESITSSGLPSITETLLTPLESPTPLFIDAREEAEENPKPVLDSVELQNFALQIANGMAFLETIKITHRDLAARNILISEDKVLKISDFGMARVGVYVNTAQKKQPLRWMAPEAVENRRCDNKTDVWSFGVVLWEIGSLGAFPYRELSNELVITHIMQGKRLQRPETCTDQVYELMQKCWQKNADQRPTFHEIAKNLHASSGKIYVDFSKISPKYVFPPAQDEND